MIKFIFVIIQLLIVGGIYLNMRALKYLSEGDYDRFSRLSKMVSWLLVVSSTICCISYIVLWTLE